MVAADNRLLPLDEVCAEWGLFNDMADPVRWLRCQILAGRIKARKIGHHWRMSRTDINNALEVFANTAHTTADDVGQTDHDDYPAVSAASRRRRMAVVAE